MDSIDSAPDPSSTSRIRVGLGERGYDIHVGAGLIDRAQSLLEPMIGTARLAIITDERVGPLHCTALATALPADRIVSIVTVPAGEATKSLEWAGRVAGELLDGGIERGDVLVALGGGVVGDLAGFVAAILHRGIDFVQVPTTLLAQVDSSVGGKTGVNAVQGKNLIGAFHQPRLVVADTGLLATLPEREMRAGYAEVVKYGLIDDPALFDRLCETSGLILGGAAELAEAVAAGCRSKARIVAEDEREGGVRGLLNLGHTFGHALEAAMGYDGRLLHGEAVSLGMVLAFELSERLGLSPAADTQRVRAHLSDVGLPVRLGNYANMLPKAADLIDLMGRDKKVRGGRKTFVLVHGIGAAFLTRDVPDDILQTLLEDALTR